MKPGVEAGFIFLTFLLPYHKSVVFNMPLSIQVVVQTSVSVKLKTDPFVVRDVDCAVARKVDGLSTLLARISLPTRVNSSPGIGTKT